MENLSIEKELLERQIAIINIYTIFHLTKSEKIKIQKSLLKCAFHELEEFKNKIIKEYTTAFEISNQDSNWSPGFIAELIKYYEEKKGFNPVLKFKENFELVEVYINLNEKRTKTPEDKEALKMLKKNIDQIVDNIKASF